MNTSQTKKQNQQKAKEFAEEIQEKIVQLFEEHRDQVKRRNQQNQRTGKHNKTFFIKSEPKNQSTFFKHLEDCYQRLKNLNKKIGSAQKMKKESKDLFGNKSIMMTNYIENLLEKKNLKVMIDENLIKMIKQTQKNLEEVESTLNQFVKESLGFCCTKIKNVEPILHKQLLELTSHCYFWQSLEKISPQIQKEISYSYIPLAYEETIFNDIDKMILDAWPETEKIEIYLEKVVYKDVEKQKSLQKFSDLSKIKEYENKNKELSDMIKELQKEVSDESLLCEAHEMLYGLGRTQHSAKAIGIYKQIHKESSNSVQSSSLKTSEMGEMLPNARICNILGSIYESGKFTNQSIKKAVEYYTVSAHQQDAEGLYKIGKFIENKTVNFNELFKEGDNIATKQEQVLQYVSYYERAANLFHLDAITDLAHIYQNGIRNQEDYSLKSSVISQSHSNTHKLDQHKKYIFKSNLEKAMYYYLKAIQQKFPRAINNFGALYIKEQQNIPETTKGSNLQKGIKYLKEAVELRYPKAYLNLGKCYENSIGLKKNLEKAKSLYIEGAELNDSQCKIQYIKCCLGNNSQKVQDQEQNYSKMMYFLRQVLLQTEQKNAQALYYMAIFQEKGLGGLMNKQSAFYYMMKSAKLNFGPAENKLGDYYYSGFFIDKNMIKAQKYYKKAAQKNDTKALINLGLLCEKGCLEGQQKSTDRQLKAKKYFIQAAKLGDSNAFIFMEANKTKNIQKQNILKAVEMGSQDAVKILARTSSTNQLQTLANKSTKQQYTNLLNHYIKEANAYANEIRNNQKTGHGKDIGSEMSKKNEFLMKKSPQVRRVLSYESRFMRESRNRNITPSSFKHSVNYTGFNNNKSQNKWKNSEYYSSNYYQE